MLFARSPQLIKKKDHKNNFNVNLNITCTIAICNATRESVARAARRAVIVVPIFAPLFFFFQKVLIKGWRDMGESWRPRQIDGENERDATRPVLGFQFPFFFFTKSERKHLFESDCTDAHERNKHWSSDGRRLYNYGSSNAHNHGLKKITRATRVSIRIKKKNKCSVLHLWFANVSILIIIIYLGRVEGAWTKRGRQSGVAFFNLF